MDEQPTHPGIGKTVLNFLRVVWIITGHVTAALSLASMTNQWVVWVDYLEGLVTFYRSIVDPFFNAVLTPIVHFFSQWFSFRVPRWVHDYLTLGTLFVAGPIMRGLFVYLSNWLKRPKSPSPATEIADAGAALGSALSSGEKGSPIWKSLPKKALIAAYLLTVIPIVLVIAVGALAVGLLVNAVLWPGYLIFLFQPETSGCLVVVFGALGGGVLNSKEVARSMRLSAIIVPLVFGILLVVNYTLLRFVGFKPG